MVKKKPKQNDRCIAVSVSHVAAPDGRSRLSHAIGILLRAAAMKNTSQLKGNPIAQKEKQQAQAPSEDALTRGSGSNDSPGNG